MKEGEARKKWCPMGRLPYLFGNTSAITGNRKGDDWTESLCIGSDCMSWRWKKDQWQCNKCGAIFQKYSETCPDDFDPRVTSCDGVLDVYYEGFCGMAGVEK